MEIILKEEITNLGEIGDVVTVNPGYARNYLVPRGLALRASKRNMAVVEEKKHIKEAQENRIEKANKILSEKLTKTTITIEVQVGEEERIFGSVTSQDIQGSLEANGISIDRSTILMEEPIKSLGVYNIPVRITADIEADLKVYIIKA